MTAIVQAGLGNFGPVDETITQRIRCADSAHLETWSLNFVDAVTLDEVFQD